MRMERQNKEKWAVDDNGETGQRIVTRSVVYMQLFATIFFLLNETKEKYGFPPFQIVLYGNGEYYQDTSAT